MPRPPVRKSYRLTAFLISVFVLAALLPGCCCLGPGLGPGMPRKGKPQFGMASWYGEKYHGFYTSSGEVYDMYKLTAAHNKLPFGTYVRVTNLENRKSVVVRINDRGPFARERIIDLSYAAARKIDMLKDGVARVRIEVVDR